VKANPGKSNRAIADEIGASYETVRRARKTTDTDVSVKKRTGKDGKARKMPTPKPAPVKDAAIEHGLDNNQTALLEAARRRRRWRHTTIEKCGRPHN
jgi:hypothetical protein